MKLNRISYPLFLVALILIFSSCHPRHVSDIRPNMTKQEVESLWGTTGLITHKTVNGKTVENWEYHFAATDSICVVTFSQDRVIHTECRQQPRPHYYAYPYPYYYPYRYYYPYHYPYPYYYPYP